MIETLIFNGSCVFRIPILRSGGSSPGVLWNAIRYAVGVNCGKGATTDTKAQMPSIWANGYVLDDCMRAI